MQSACFFLFFFFTPIRLGGIYLFFTLVPNLLNYDMVLNEYEHQLLYDIHFRTNTLEKIMDSLIS